MLRPSVPQKSTQRMNVKFNESFEREKKLRQEIRDSQVFKKTRTALVLRSCRGLGRTGKRRGVVFCLYVFISRATAL